MNMPGRKFTQGGSAYRYGFNGKENDNDVKGEGNQQDYGMRIYDPRLGRFLSVDPLTKEYPELTPYQFASNRPIDGIDLDGLEYAPSGYTDPKQMLYQAGADMTRALGRAYDKFTGFFASWGNSDETELTKTKSIVVTNEKSIDVGGNMESWIQGGRYSTNNTMPKLKLSNFWDIQYKDETKIELKTKVEAGNVKVENKINLSDGSTEVKSTVKIPANQVTKVPLKISGSVSNNTTTNTTKTKVEVKTDTKPIAVGGSIEVQKDNNGNVNGKAAVSASYEKKVGKVTHTSTLTVGKKF